MSVRKRKHIEVSRKEVLSEKGWKYVTILLREQLTVWRMCTSFKGKLYIYLYILAASFHEKQELSHTCVSAAHV